MSDHTQQQLPAWSTPSLHTTKKPLPDDFFRCSAQPSTSTLCTSHSHDESVQLRIDSHDAVSRCDCTLWCCAHRPSLSLCAESDLVAKGWGTFPVLCRRLSRVRHTREAKLLNSFFDAACIVNVAMNAWLPQASYPCGTCTQLGVTRN